MKVDFEMIADHATAAERARCIKILSLEINNMPRPCKNCWVSREGLEEILDQIKSGAEPKEGEKMERGDYVQPATPSLHKLIYGNMASGPWRPIAEAPRDGTIFLAAFGPGDYTLLKWKENIVTSAGSCGAWQLTDREIYYEPESPTHFALINPPTREAENEQK